MRCENEIYANDGYIFDKYDDPVCIHCATDYWRMTDCCSFMVHVDDTFLWHQTGAVYCMDCHYQIDCGKCGNLYLDDMLVAAGEWCHECKANAQATVPIAGTIIMPVVPLVIT